MFDDAFSPMTRMKLRVLLSCARIHGQYPLVRLRRLPENTSSLVLGKLEGNNPAGSVKDRPALSMIPAGRARGEIRPGDVLIGQPAAIPASRWR